MAVFPFSETEWSIFGVYPKKWAVILFLGCGWFLLGGQASAQDPEQGLDQALREAGIFGSDEDFLLSYDRKLFEFSEGFDRGAALFYGNVVVTGRGFELHCDAIGFFVEGLSEGTGRNALKNPRAFALGNILLIRADQSFRAESMFIDVDARTAVFTKARLRVDQHLIERLREIPIGEPERSRELLESFGATSADELPITDESNPLVFAAEVLTVEDFQRIRGEGIEVTTCEFGHPHWALEADSGSAREREEIDPLPGEQEPGGWLFEMDDVWLRAGPISIPILPGFIWDSRWGRYLPIKSASYSSSGKFGNRIDTLWNGNLLLPDALSREMDLGIRLDYLSKRGTGYGTDVEWGRDPLRWSQSPDGRVELFGIGQWWAIDDRGTDRDGTQPSDSHRYRSRFHQRMRLQSGTWIDFEYAAESDANFLDEYFEDEARAEKTPENIVFVRQPLTEAGQLSILVQRRGVDYRSVLEKLPEMRLQWVEEMESSTRIVLDGEASIARLDNRPADDLMLGSAENQRGDARLLTARPLQLARGLRLRPYVEGRYTYWDEDAFGEHEERVAWAGGATLSTRLQRTFGTLIPSLDIRGLRHVIDFDVSFESVFDTNVEPADLIVMDEVDEITERESIRLGMYQRLFTRRDSHDRQAQLGYAVRAVADLRTEIEWFPDPDRDNEGQEWGPLQWELLLRPIDPLGLFVDGEANLEEGDFEEINAGVRWFDPRAVVFEVSSRKRRHEQNSLLVGARWWGSEKYGFGIFTEIDFRRDKTVNQRFDVARNFHRWTASFSIEYDEGEDNTTLRVNLGPRDLLGWNRR